MGLTCCIDENGVGWYRLQAPLVYLLAKVQVELQREHLHDLLMTATVLTSLYSPWYLFGASTIQN